MIGLILQRKSVTEVVRGTVMTGVGFFVLSTGTSLITGNSIDGISAACNSIMPQAVKSTTVNISAEYGTEIGIVMILAFAINILVARFTKWKSIFLTGHMLYWFPLVFIAAGVDAGLSGIKLIALAAVFTALYMVVFPNLMRPFVKEVTGDDSFTIGHPTTCLSAISGLIGNKRHSTEELSFPKSLGFLREIAITGSFAIGVTYIVMYIILVANGQDPAVVWGYAEGKTGAFTYIFTHVIYFGVGITIMLQGVRMLIAEIVPAFQGIAEKIVPDAIPALDVPVIFPYAPNALLIGLIVAMITSILTILITGSMGISSTVVIPLISTCFFEIGCAAIVGNATGGVRGAVVGAAVCGVILFAS
ncbi:hypothetical protein K6V98_04120 [Collinsella sp. AGMB00827]|uniref:Ascorbate-specific PTS system EIIC component n=2 Tax=Collinsella ureilytica TaxID=2869515 RepID=A0ABS7MKH6_9ACTN|nr:hypothetical protein [Collinsella urealyticum]